MKLTLQDAMRAKKLIRYDYGRPVHIKLTGKFIEANTITDSLVEYKEGFFGSKAWISLRYLDIVKEFSDDQP